MHWKSAVHKEACQVWSIILSPFSWYEIVWIWVFTSTYPKPKTNKICKVMFEGPSYYDLPLSNSFSLTLSFKDWGHLSFLSIYRGPVQIMAMPEKMKQTERQTDGQNQNQTKQETTSAVHPQFQLAAVVRGWIVFHQMDDLVISIFYNSPLFDVIHFQ